MVQQAQCLLHMLTKNMNNNETIINNNHLVHDNKRKSMYTYVNVKGTKKDCYRADKGKAKNKIHSFLLSI